MATLKTSISLTREEAQEIVESFQEILQEPVVAKIVLFFDTHRLTTVPWLPLPSEVHPFIAVEKEN